MRGPHSGVTGPAHTLRSRQTELPGGRADAAHAGQGGEELVLLLLGGGPSGRRICAGPAGDGAGLVGPMEAGLDVDAQRPGREAHALHPVQQGKELVLVGLRVLLARFPARRSRPGTAGIEVESQFPCGQPNAAQTLQGQEEPGPSGRGVTPVSTLQGRRGGRNRLLPSGRQQPRRPSVNAGPILGFSGYQPGPRALHHRGSQRLKLSSEIGVQLTSAADHDA